MTSPNLFELMREAHVGDIATGLGRETSPPRNSSGGAIYGCPKCGAECRHTQARDRRGAIGVLPNGRGWKCWQCDASGDGTDLVAYVLHGAPYRDLDSLQKGEVRAWCLVWLGIETSTASLKRAPRMLAQDRKTEPLPPPPYPPNDEVLTLWGAGRPVIDAAPTRAFLYQKNIDPMMVADLDLARALPLHTAVKVLPAWAYYGRRCWRQAGFHLMTPMFDHRGAMRSVNVRHILSADSPLLKAMAKEINGKVPKALPPKGYGRSGLIMGCPLTQQLLAREGSDPVTWWPRLRAEVGEGAKKMIQRITTRSDADEFAPAVIGIESGSWTSDIAARIPDGTTIYIATDQDVSARGESAGAGYATTIMRTLEDRIRAGSVHIELRHEFALKVDQRGGFKVEVAL